MSFIDKNSSKNQMLEWLESETRENIRQVIMAINEAPDYIYSYRLTTTGSKDDLLDELYDLPKKAIWYGIDEVFPDDDEDEEDYEEDENDQYELDSEEHEDEDDDDDNLEEEYSGNYTLYKPSENPYFNYELSVLNLDIDPDNLINKIKTFYKIKNQKDGYQTLTILKYGESGTGKTHFAKLIAHKLKKDLLILSASSFLSRFVGETERNISYLFKLAEKNDYIVFIDEIEGLIRSRRDLDVPHDFTQVNELLIKMENFKGVCIGATNLAEKIDEAFTRRFILKIKFSHMSENGKIEYFENKFKKILKNSLTNQDITRLKNLTNLSIGDFESVYRRMILDDRKFNSNEIVNELTKESAYKIMNSNDFEENCLA